MVAIVRAAAPFFSDGYRALWWLAGGAVRSLPFQLSPRPELVLQYEFPVVGVEFHNHKLAVIDVPQVFKVFDAEVVPFHEENSRHQAVRDKYANAGKVIFPKATPQALVETTNTVICISRGLPVRYSVKEVPVVGTFLPHAAHLG